MYYLIFFWYTLNIKLPLVSLITKTFRKNNVLLFSNQPANLVNTNPLFELETKLDMLSGFLRNVFIF